MSFFNRMDFLIKLPTFFSPPPFFLPLTPPLFFTHTLTCSLTIFLPPFFPSLFILYAFILYFTITTTLFPPSHSTTSPPFRTTNNSPYTHTHTTFFLYRHQFLVLSHFIAWLENTALLYPDTCYNKLIIISHLF